MIPIRDDVPARRIPVITWGLIAVNCAIFAYQLGRSPQQLEQIFFLHGLVPARLSHPDWAREVGFPGGGYLTLLSSAFLHGGWLHLIANMWTLWIFGDNVEDRMGPVRFLAFYLICGVASGVLHWLSNADSVVPTVGASGAIAGVLGAYFLLYPRARVLTLFPVLFLPLFFEIPAIAFLLIWFATQVIQGAMSGGGPGEVSGVAWWAHVGGFIAGVLLHWVFLDRDPPPPLPEGATRWRR